ncbi:MAG: ion transporter [Bacteroidota bacterium]
MLKRFFLSERNMMTAILINAAVIFLLYFPEIQHNETLIQIDHFFVLFFLMEAIVKLIVFKPKGYFANSWNWFDFIIVVVSLPSLFMTYLPLPDTSSLLLLRVFRLVRLFRLMQFVPHLTMILSGLGRAIKASIFVLMVLLFLDLTLAILTCHFYQDIAPEYFGNPLISAYTVFQLFTVEGWNEVADVIANNSEGVYSVSFTRFFFVLIVLIGGIFGMSLANAVFVDEMTMDNNRELEDKIDRLQSEIRQIRELLEKRDV